MIAILLAEIPEGCGPRWLQPHLWLEDLLQMRVWVSPGCHSLSSLMESQKRAEMGRRFLRLSNLYTLMTKTVKSAWKLATLEKRLVAGNYQTFRCHTGHFQVASLAWETGNLSKMTLNRFDMSRHHKQLYAFIHDKLCFAADTKTSVKFSADKVPRCRERKWQKKKMNKKHQVRWTIWSITKLTRGSIQWIPRRKQTGG